jgi:hypothetical protein
MTDEASDASSSADERFYAELGELHHFAEVTDPSRYAEVPRSWLVAITDVRGSTRAIEAGRYRDVNALGVASIIGVKNALRDVDIPFVFGGDGATLLVPGSRRHALESALRGARLLATQAFSLALRTSIVPVARLYDSGFVPKVARFRASPLATLAMLSGGAYAVAEAWVKDAESGAHWEVPEEGAADVDFEGFECRWQPVASRRGRVVCLLVLACGSDEALQIQTYGRILSALEALVAPDLASPIKATALNFTGLGGDFSTEARVRSGQGAGAAFDLAEKAARKQTAVGSVLSALRVSAFGFDGASYKREVEQNTDFRKFDDTLRMVLDVTTSELAQIVELLESEQRAGHVAYGAHSAHAALMTCFVRSHRGDHLHFIDGADGGYALAAKQLKANLARVRG